MAWKKSSPEMVAFFARAVPDDPRVTRRPMFGYPAAFANGNMFISLFREDFVLRLSASDHSRFVARYGERPFAPMAGRTMRNYVRAPQALLDDEAERSAWIGRALANALTLPEKAQARRRKEPVG